MMEPPQEQAKTQLIAEASNDTEAFTLAYLASSESADWSQGSIGQSIASMIGMDPHRSGGGRQERLHHTSCQIQDSIKQGNFRQVLPAAIASWAAQCEPVDAALQLLENALELVLNTFEGAIDIQLIVTPSGQHIQRVPTHFDSHVVWSTMLFGGHKNWYVLPPDALDDQAHSGAAAGNANERLDISPTINTELPWQQINQRPGQTVILPATWWHHVETSSESTLTVNICLHVSDQPPAHADPGAETALTPPPLPPPRKRALHAPELQSPAIMCYRNTDVVERFHNKRLKDVAAGMPKCHVLDSAIPGAGKGLFMADVGVSAGAPVQILSHGPVSTRNTGRCVMLEKAQWQKYQLPMPASTLDAHDEYPIDGGMQEGKMGGAANEASSKEACNARIIKIPGNRQQMHGFTVIVADGDIHPGQEVLVWYGPDDTLNGWRHRQPPAPADKEATPGAPQAGAGAEPTRP